MIQKLSRFSPFIGAFIVFLGYLYTLAPSVIQIDTGELAAAQALAGIPHPTGYPLFAILGHLFSLLPIFQSKIYQLNLLTAIWCSLGVGMFIQFLIMLTREISAFANPKKIATGKKSQVKKEVKTAPKEQVASFQNYYELFIALLTAGIALGFSKTFWFQATSVEVYSLHIFLIICTLYSLIQAFIKTNKRETGAGDKYWYYFALVLALSFANHMTTILIIPLTAYLFFKSNGFNKRTFLLLGKMLAMFFPLLILLYLYIPLRASANPPVNWGNAVDWERFMRHFTGKQYQVWMFSSFDESKKQLAYFISNFPTEFQISLLLVVLGLIELIRKYRMLLWITMILFVSTVMYSINYSISDIDSYFLLAYISLGIPVFFGTDFLIRLLRDRNTGYILPVSALVVFLGLQAYLNGETNDQSRVHIYEDYTKSILYSAPKNSLVLSYQWDYFISASYYFQKVEGIRKDVRIVDKELLRRSWYYQQVKRNYPDILNGIEPVVATFLEDLKLFERSEDFNAAALENGYRTIMRDMIKFHLAKGPVYIGPELVENEYQRGEFILPEGYTFVPDVFFYKVVPNDGIYKPLEYPDVTIRVPSREDKYITNLTKIIGGMFINRAFYDIQAGRKDLARKNIKKLNGMFPNYVIPKELLELIQ